MSEKNVNNNGTQETIEQNVQETPVQQTPATPVPGTVATQPVAQPVAQPQQEGWFKTHWKGLTAGAAAVVTAATSAWLAYKKGKAAGIASVPQQPVQQTEPEDYSLNPNV